MLTAWETNLTSHSLVGATISYRFDWLCTSVVVTWQVVPAPPQLGRSCQLLPLKQNISREAEINIYRGSNSLNTSDCVGKALGDIFASDFGFFSSYISADVAVLSEQ